MFLGRDCKPEALEGSEQWVVFPGVISATEMLSQPAKKAGMGWTFLGEDPEALISSPMAAGLFPAASLRLLQVKLLQAGSTLAMLQNSWHPEDNFFFLVEASWGWRPRAAELWGQSLLDGDTHAGLQEQQSCRHHFSTSFFHIAFPPHKYECSPSAKVHGSN